MCSVGLRPCHAVCQLSFVSVFLLAGGFELRSSCHKSGALPSRAWVRFYNTSVSFFVEVRQEASLLPGQFIVRLVTFLCAGSLAHQQVPWLSGMAPASTFYAVGWSPSGGVVDADRR